MLNTALSDSVSSSCLLMSVQVWTAERSTQLGMAVSTMLKGYTTTAAQIITAMLKSVTKFTIQVKKKSFNLECHSIGAGVGESCFSSASMLLSIATTDLGVTLNRSLVALHSQRPYRQYKLTSKQQLSSGAGFTMPVVCNSSCRVPCVNFIYT